MSVELKNIRSIAEALFPYNCGVVTPDNNALFHAMTKFLPFKTIRFKSGSEFNGWKVPKCWEVKRAEVRTNGNLLFDGTKHPLGVAALSKSFRGKLTSKQLRPHIHTRPDVPSAHGYHCMWQYRPWDRDWCLCVPHSQFKKWPKNGSFSVDLITKDRPGFMKVAEYHLPGKSKKTFVINAHTCHPRQANDDIVGMAVAIALFQKLRKRKNRYSYRLVLGPEHLGTVFYLSRMPERERKRILGGYFLEMPGTPYPLKVASSFHGDSVVDYAIREICAREKIKWRKVGWRQGAGNDETVWEAPGYEIPFVEISRCKKTFKPFREYHTSADNIENINWKNVKVFYNLIFKSIKKIEKIEFLERKFNGLPCLSNPKINLYNERYDPAVKKKKISHSLGYLNDHILRYFDGKTPILYKIKSHQKNYKKIKKIIKNFRSKGLIY
jgi:aminopeptidase-like protein